MRRGAIGWEFRALWTGQLLSAVGSGMSAFALGIHVYTTTGTVTAVSQVLLSILVPGLLLKPLGGLLADRLDRRALMAAADIGGAVAMLLVLGVLSRPTPPYTLLLAFVALGSACSAIREPAYKASVSDLVLPDGYGRAAGLVQLSSASRHFLGPLGAGLLLGVAPLQTVIAMDIASFLIAAMITISVATAGTEAAPADVSADGAAGGQPGAGSALGHGRRRDLIWIAAVLTLATTAAGVVQTLVVPLLLGFTNATRAGVVQSIAALGMLASSLLLGALLGTRHPNGLFSTGLLVTSASIAAFGAGRALPAAAVALVLLYAALPLVNTAAEVLLRQRIGEVAQGRNWARIGVVTQSGYLLAYLMTGPLTDRLVGPQTMLTLTGLALFAGSLIYIVRAAQARKGTVIPC